LNSHNIAAALPFKVLQSGGPPEKTGQPLLAQAWVSVGRVWLRSTLTRAPISSVNGMSFLKRISEFWPYALIAIAVTGYAYQFWNGRL
jgi:hypothetical protein